MRVGGIRAVRALTEAGAGDCPLDWGDTGRNTKKWTDLENYRT